MKLFVNIVLLIVAVLLVIVTTKFETTPTAVHAGFVPGESTTGGNVYTVTGGLWRTDGGFVSTLRIKNNLVSAPLLVNPTLYMADGTPYQLAPVTLATGGVDSVNINDALSQAVNSIPGHISDFGTVELTYRYSSPGHLMAQVQSLDVARSLSLEFPLMEKWAPITGGANTTVANNSMPPSGPQTVEGLWWKRDTGVEGSILLTNTTSTEQSATVQLIGPAGGPQPTSIQLAPHAAAKVGLDSLAGVSDLLRLGAGGIRIQYSGEMGDVVVAGGLLNPSEGYSANMPFWWHDSNSKPAPMGYASAGIMTGKADPMAGFPAETVFSGYLALRNTTSAPMKLAIELNYMQGSAPVSRSIPVMLAAGEARQIQLTELMASRGIKEFNGSINLGVSFTGRMGDLVIATGSVDQTGTYVFEVKPEPVGAGLRRIGDHWEIANGNDTMVSLWNPTSQAEDIEATFLYGDGSGQYVMDIHLAPGASTALDMKQIIDQGLPDKNGNRIPLGVTEGSVMFANAAGANKPLAIVVSLAVYNVADGTCCGQCINCCGYSNFSVDPGGFTMGVGQQMTCTCTATDCSGTQYTMSGTWRSSNTSILAFNGNVGVVTGVAPGTANINVDLGFLEVTSGSYCGGGSCPESDVQPGTGGTVVPVIAQNQNLWWFGNGNSPPLAFNLGGITATLTANGAGNGTYAWSVTNGTSRLVFENNSSTITKTNTNTVGISSVGYSTQLNDVTVQLQFEPSAGTASVTTSYSLSVDSPYKLVSTGPTSNRGVTGTDCSTSAPTGTNGFQSLVPYKIMSFLGVQISNIGVNETFATQTDDYIGTNWPAYTAGSSTTLDGTFVDDICAIFPTGTPSSLPPQSPLSTVKIDHASQFWFVGSTTEGSGIEVQGDTLQRYQDHGLHNTITSPVR